MSGRASSEKPKIAKIRTDCCCSMPAVEMGTSGGGEAVPTMNQPAEHGLGGARLLAFAIIGYVACAGLLAPNVFVDMVASYSGHLQDLLALAALLLFLKVLRSRPYSSA